MTTERLTRQEIGWLLAQEARGAARALREGMVQIQKPELRDSLAPVETSLDALDDAIELLSTLQSSAAKGRRGRFDVAAMICKLAPDARIGLEPGAGTEVVGEEAELERMLHVLVRRGGGGLDTSSREVQVRRIGDWVRVSVELGPDEGPVNEVEQRWLARMATRHGGRVELEGSTQSLVLPADGASDQREMAALRKELEQAQQLGEAYARELAQVLTFGADTRPPSVIPAPPGEAMVERFDLLLALARSVAPVLRRTVEGQRADAAAVAAALGDGNELVQSIQRRVSQSHELLGELERVARCPEPDTESDLVLEELVSEVIEAAGARAARHGVRLTRGASATVRVRTLRRVLALGLRAIVDQAIAATPRDAVVTITARRSPLGAELEVVDGGPTVVGSSHADLVQSRLEPQALGRPGGVGLLVAHTAAARLGGVLELGDAGEHGFRVTLRLPA
ncbi:MAG: HAMP domain-containing histidine kinase [Polyangiaceae bacterium]|nr:HAMP domain-containing histidine kinase [Polyangiaceae bacterium]